PPGSADYTPARRSSDLAFVANGRGTEAADLDETGNCLRHFGNEAPVRTRQPDPVVSDHAGEDAACCAAFGQGEAQRGCPGPRRPDRKSTRLNSSHVKIS